MPYRSFSIALLLWLIGCGHGGPSAERIADEKPAAPAFAPGQVWRYRARPSEERSRIIIGRIDTVARLGRIIHIHVNGLRMKSPMKADLIISVGHMPYAEDALRTSVVKLEVTGASIPPGFEDGYQQWRAAFDKGDGGVWTVPVSEAITAMERATSRR